MLAPGTPASLLPNPKELVSAIRRILQWLVPSGSSAISLDDKGTPIRSTELVDAVRAFYTTQTFGLLNSQIRSQVSAASSGKDMTFSCYDNHVEQIDPWMSAGEAGFSFLSKRAEASKRPRCLHGMPDLGNPNILGGLCWWK